jgi:transposase
MTQSVSSGPIFIGIDVAKAKLDLGRSDVPHILTVTNDLDGIGQILQMLSDLKPAIIVIEATGGLERPLLDALLDADLPAALVNPGRVRHLAIGLGILAKTDAIDARVLVEFARLAAPRLSEKRSKHRVELDALITCRRQLVHVKTEQTNRRATTTSKSAIKAIDAVLLTVDKQIRKLDGQIKDLIEGDDDLYRQDKMLRAVPGVGAVLSTMLLAELEELGQVDRRQISALVGLRRAQSSRVAPINRDSGDTTGPRSIRGGRTTVRCTLYMATLAAMRFNPVISAFARRLAGTGKKGKVLIVACMRKLLCLLNAMLRDNLQWHELNVVRRALALGGGAK